MILLHTITDRALPEGLDLSPGLRTLITARLAQLDADLLPYTEIVAVQPYDTEAEVTETLGQWPLIDPWDGYRWPNPLFQNGFDYVIAYPAAYLIAFSFGSSFGQLVFVERREGVLPDLLALCDAFVGASDREP